MRADPGTGSKTPSGSSSPNVAYEVLGLPCGGIYLLRAPRACHFMGTAENICSQRVFRILTHNRRRVWTCRSIINVGDGRKVLGSGHRIMRVLRRHHATPGSLTFVARAAAVWPSRALAQQSACKVWACRILYPSKRSPYKKIDAAPGDGKR